MKCFSNLGMQATFKPILSLLLFLSFLVSFPVYAQDIQFNYISDIDEEMLVDANAVIKDQFTEITLLSKSKMQVKGKKVVSVLNEKGDFYGTAYLPYDKSKKVSKLSVGYYNQIGNEIIKVKKNKFEDISAISRSSLYTDDRVYYFRKTPISYPYTMVFEYEFETSNTLYLPHWYPVPAYGVSVVNSSFTVNNPDLIYLKRMTKNLDEYDINIEDLGNSLTYTVKNIAAIEKEDYSVPLDELVPYLRVSPSEFTHEGISGEFTNWESVGQWIYSELLSEQGALPDEAKREINELVKGVDDTKERVRIVYEYMQNRCRYISVQIGIGGWKPVSAERVHNTSYGDCKALTNYTMSLLKEVGIPSYYTLVYGSSNPWDIDEDFISLQGNHAILCVPIENDTLWLECTSDDSPCGYIANFTDDRDVFVVFPDGGKIQHTKKYADDIHLEKTHGICRVLEDNSILVDVLITNHGSYYGHAKFLSTLKDDEVKKYYKNNWELLTDISLSEYSFVDKKDIESFEESLIIIAPEYIKSFGNSMIMRPFVLLDITNYNINSSLEKKRDLYIGSSKTIQVEFDITLPDNLYFDKLPEPIMETYAFGTYIVKIEQIDKHTIKYFREFSLTKGSYPKEEYVNYVAMLKKVKKSDAMNILIEKM